MYYRFLQGPETDRDTVKKIRDAIDNQKDVTVQLINYTRSGMLTCFLLLRQDELKTLKTKLEKDVTVLDFSGKKFWNLFHLQPMRDHKVIFQ